MKIFRFILILALGLQVGFGEGEELNFLADKNDGYVSGGQCTWSCRKVKSGYGTEIVDYDFQSGKTICVVFKGDRKNIVGSADKTNTACSFSDNIDKKYTDEYQKLLDEKHGSYGSSIQYNSKQEKLNMSKFIVGLLTLNPNIIDRERTTTKGEIKIKGEDESLFNVITVIRKSKSESDSVLKDSVDLINKENSIYGINAMAYSEKTTNMLDAFNRNNMAYFNDLFASMEKIYQHLQIFIFVLIGGFFVTQIGASKLQAYLENRGESEGKQPYLHKFYIPLLMIGIFFMPIPEGNGHQSTVMQNMIRYFAQYSTTIADMAHSVGAKTYMDKIYKEVGGLNPEVVASVALQDAKQNHFINQTKNSFIENCRNRYGFLETQNYYNQNNMCDNFITANEQEAQRTQNIISCNTCDKYYQKLEIYKDYNKQLQIDKQKMLKFKTTYKDKLDEIDKYFVVRNNQLGWIDVLLTPTSSILVETFTVSEAGLFESESQREYEEKEKALKENRANIQMGNKSDLNAKENEINDGFIGFVAGRLVFMMLPGATAIKDFIEGGWVSLTTALGTILGGLGGVKLASTGVGIGLGVKTGIAGAVLGFVGGLVSKVVGSISGIGTILSYYAASILMEWTIEKIPLLVISTSCLVSFISYLISLCKYFYISPFVTAWAMATKKVDKIVDFLLVGISIFLTPILIILFVYLALFLNVLVEDFFVFVSIEQFAGIKTSVWDFHTNFIIGAISGLLKIFGMLAASYTSWRLIVSGPSWALSLVGLDSKHDNMIAQGLETNLAKRAFVA